MADQTGEELYKSGVECVQSSSMCRLELKSTLTLNPEVESRICVRRGNVDHTKPLLIDSCVYLSIPNAINS
jgi:hypothetical protein